MKIDKIELELTQITPLFHFKYGKIRCKYEKSNECNIFHVISKETNEGLRGTEIKPRFMKYLNSLSEETYDPTHFRISVEQVVQNVQTLKEGALNIINKIPGNTKSCNLEETFINLSDIIITLKIISEEEGIDANKVFQEFIRFLNSYSFGKRSSKGYGSFEVKKIKYSTVNKKLNIKEKIKFDKKIPKSRNEISEKNIIKFKKEITNTVSEKDIFEIKFLYPMLLGSNSNTPYGEDDNQYTVNDFLKEGKEIDGIFPPYRIKFGKGWIGILYEEDIMNANIEYMKENIKQKYENIDFNEIKLELEEYIKNKLLDDFLC